MDVQGRKIPEGPAEGFSGTDYGIQRLPGQDVNMTNNAGGQ